MQLRIAAAARMSACLLLVLVNGFVLDANANSSAVGNWILNPSKSHFQNMPAPKLKRLRVLKDDEKALSWRTSGYDPEGKTFHDEYDGPIDGAFHPMTGSDNPGSVAYTRTNSVIHWTIKDQAGVIVETGSESLSPDGDALTATGTRKTPQGEATFTAVHDRVK